MESARDISKKIRSAIKAKLVELGAYVDDELPDYIMVMVANKKTQNQMTEDLSLFLGANTDKFTTWLHGLLVKLQNLSSDNKKVVEKEKITKSDSMPQEKKAQKTGSSSKENTVDINKTDSSIKKTDVQRVTVKRKLSEKSSKNLVVKNIGSSETKPVNTKQKDEEYVSELLETVETDEFSEEFKKEEESRRKPVVTKLVKPVTASPVLNVKKPHVTQAETPQKTGSKMIPTRDLSYPQPPPRKKVVSKKVKTVVKEKSNLSAVKPSFQGKKAFSSVVGTVKKRYTEMPDEEYDPLNPSFGKLSSSVKVQRKRLAVPPSLQANKTLIMKATAEAEKSVSSTLNKVLKEERLYSAREQATVRPVQRKVPELRHPKIRPNIELVSKSKREEMIRKMTYTVENENSEPKEAESMKIVVENKLKSGVENQGLEKMTYTVVNKQSKGKHDQDHTSEVQYVISPEYPSQQTVQVIPSQPLQYLARLPSGMYTETTEPHLLTYLKVEPQQVDPEPVQSSLPAVARVHPVIGNRLVKRKSVDSNEDLEEDMAASDIEIYEEEASNAEEDEFETEIADTDETSNEGQMYAQLPLVKDSVEHEEYVEDEGEDSLNLDVDEDRKTPVPSPEPPTQRFIKERASTQRKVNPKFIVTLDGIDPSAFENYTESDIKSETSRQGVPVVSKITPPAITPITFNLQDTDDEEEEQEESPSKKSKITEKCKFWPACVNGNACSYHHPTTPCKMFPNCKFGDKCLYIHPNCKFDAKCTKKDCPFTHASKRGNTPTVIKQYIPMPVPTAPSYQPGPQGKIPCRFGSNCQNMYCPFLHPTYCRYGSNCANRASCPFTHPPLQTQFSWTAGKSLNNGVMKLNKPNVVTKMRTSSKPS